MDFGFWLLLVDFGELGRARSGLAGSTGVALALAETPITIIIIIIISSIDINIIIIIIIIIILIIIIIVVVVVVIIMIITIVNLIRIKPPCVRRNCPGVKGAGHTIRQKY